MFDRTDPAYSAYIRILEAELIPATDDQPATVKTIEGNSGDSVAYQTYNLDDSRIMGYGAMPLQSQNLEETAIFPCGMEEHAHAESCYDERGNLSCQLSEHTHTEECKNKQLFYSDDTIRAYVTIKGVEELKGASYAIIPDQIEAGTYMAAVAAAGGNIVGKMAILAEGDAKDREDILYLEPLPLFRPDGSVLA